jgi:1,4-dihydroxy-2-naphthoate octaprenyltransferase
MYSVAIMPIMVGSAVAYGETQVFQGGIFFTFLLSAILILLWENFSNDVFDSETGIDIHKAHSLVNMTHRKGLIFALANGALGLGLLGIGAIALQQRDATVIGLIALCCGLGYVYQGPPFRLGYQGLGEILCFFSFGPLAVGAAYYSQTQTWSVGSQLAGGIVGITTSLVLLCSHFHQVEDDIAAGKRSPIVRMGTQWGAYLVVITCAVVLVGTAMGVAAGLFPGWTLLVWASAPAGLRLGRHVLRYHHQPSRISNAKFYAIGFHFWSGVLLAVSFVLPQ